MPSRLPRRYQVLRATTAPLPGVEAGGKLLRFGKADAFTVGDPALARDIEQKYGPKARGADKGKVVVVDVPDRREQKERGYRVVFGCLPEMPWKKKNSQKKTRGRARARGGNNE